MPLRLRLIQWKRTRDLQQRVASAFQWGDSVKGSEYWNSVVLSLGDELHNQELALLSALRTAGYDLNPGTAPRQAIADLCPRILGNEKLCKELL